MRKLFSLFLALVATTSLWAYDFQSGDLYYNITSETTVEVTYNQYVSYDNYSSLTTAIIPETVTYNDITYSVTSIGSYTFSLCSSLTSVTIGNSVTSIRHAAFSGCSSLTSITIPNSVTSIGDFAFISCSSLTSVTIPNSVTSIGDVAFLDCSSLTSPVYNAHCFAYMPTTFKGAYVIPEGIKQIAGYAFYDCSSLTSVTIPNSVTSIGDYAFYGCSSLTSVTIPNSVTSIGDLAFFGCIFTKDNFVNNSTLDAEKNNYWEARIGDKEIDGLLIKDDTILVACRTHLTSVTIPNSVTSIGDEAFYKCSSLTSVAIPDGVTSIGEWAFYDCSSLTSITIPNSVTSIGDLAFSGCSSLTSVTIGNSVTSIGWGAFEDCSSLTSITIPNSVTSIGDEAFSGCSSLTSVTIPNGVRYIEDETFYECSKLKSIIIPESVEGIGYDAFYGCSSLTSITIPNNVMVIETGAFAKCSSLNSLTIGNSVKYIGEIVFRECSALTSIVWNAETCTDFDFEYDIDYKTYNAPFYEIRSQITSFVFGDSVQHIPAYLCYGMDNLSSITIPNSVTSIGDSIFFDCSKFTSVAWNVKSYDDFSEPSASLFYDSRSQITSFTFGENVEHIPAYFCYGMDKLTSVNTPNSLKTIGTSAFEGCARLGKINLGTGLEDIAANAFAGCTRLYDIYVYATYPPFADESSFANYNVYLYVPCENQREYILDIVWGKFKFIECLSADEVEDTEDVEIDAGSTDVTFTWPTEENAYTYTIVIEKDGEVFCTLTFNAEGQLLNIAFAPGRDGNHPAQYAEQAGKGYRFTVTGLNEGTHYTYNIDVKDASNKTIKSHSGEFTTQSTTAVDNITTNNANSQKIIRDGQLIILRDGIEYNAIGQEL